MRFGRFATFLAGFLLAGIAVALPASAVTHSRRGPTSPKLVAKHSVKPKPKSQTSIDDQRAVEIQAALVKSGYLSGPPSGHWDPATEAAMAKLQADNGWQTKLVPDSRALIKIGLGPASAAKPDSGSNAAQATPLATLPQP